MDFATRGSFVQGAGPQTLDIVIAYALALVIGWSCQPEACSAGLRTVPLVAVAGCGVMQLGEGLDGTDAEAVARVLTGVATGIGFIGAGAILKGSSEVHGTTTAASIWAIGAAVRIGGHYIAVALRVFTAGALYLLMPLKISDTKPEP